MLVSSGILHSPIEQLFYKRICIMKKYNAPQMNASEVNPTVTRVCGWYLWCSQLIHLD